MICEKLNNSSTHNLKILFNLEKLVMNNFSQGKEESNYRCKLVGTANLG